MTTSPPLAAARSFALLPSVGTWCKPVVAHLALRVAILEAEQLGTRRLPAAALIESLDGDGVPLKDLNCARIGSDEDKAARKPPHQFLCDATLHEPSLLSAHTGTTEMMVTAKARMLPRNRVKVRDMVSAIEQRIRMSKVNAAASTRAHASSQDLQPGFGRTAAALQPGLERRARAAELAKEKAGELVEQVKPIKEAHEKTSKIIYKTASTNDATASWLRTCSVPVTESDDTDAVAAGGNDMKELVVGVEWTVLSNSKHCESLPNQKDAKASGQEGATGGEVIIKEAASVPNPTNVDRLD